jgi:hypothetical protein
MVSGVVGRGLGVITMRATYEARLSVILKAGAAVAVSDESKPGVIFEHDGDGNLIRLRSSMRRSGCPEWMA